MLLERGADAGVTDLDGMGLVHACVEAADPRLLRRVVSAGASVRQRDKSGSEPIHLAAANGNVACLEVLLACDKIDVNARDGEGRSALLLASVGGHANFVETLVKDKRVDVNLANSGGNKEKENAGFKPVDGKKIEQTALHLASQNGKLDVVKVLLNTRPDLDIVKVDGTGRTVLHNVVLHDTPELTKVQLLVACLFLFLNPKKKTVVFETHWTKRCNCSACDASARSGCSRVSEICEDSH